MPKSKHSPEFRAKVSQEIWMVWVLFSSLLINTV